MFYIWKITVSRNLLVPEVVYSTVFLQFRNGKVVTARALKAHGVLTGVAPLLTWTLDVGEGFVMGAV
jgi:hypothetical protein